MKGTASICVSLVLAPAVLVGALASKLDVPQRTDDDGMEFEATVEAVTSADGLRTVVTAAPASSSDPVRGFVVQSLTPTPVSYSGSAHVRFKPGVLTVVLRDGRAWQFVVERTGIFEPRPPVTAIRRPVAGISNHQADFRAGDMDHWRMFLMGAGSADAGVQALAPGTDSPPACPWDAPDVCAGGGSGSTSCSYTCGGTSCSTTCSAGYYACCWCQQSALCGCCLAGTTH